MKRTIVGVISGLCLVGAIIAGGAGIASDTPVHDDVWLGMVLPLLLFIAAACFAIWAVWLPSKEDLAIEARREAVAETPALMAGIIRCFELMPAVNTPAINTPDRHPINIPGTPANAHWPGTAGVHIAGSPGIHTPAKFTPAYWRMLVQDPETTQTGWLEWRDGTDPRPWYTIGNVYPTPLAVEPPPEPSPENDLR